MSHLVKGTLLDYFCQANIMKCTLADMHAPLLQMATGLLPVKSMNRETVPHCCLKASVFSYLSRDLTSLAWA